MTVKLYKGNCLELMREIPDKSVDLVLTDPPYGTTACKWDSIIDFSEVWKEVDRILSVGSSALMFASGSFEPRMMLSNLDEYKYKWVWVKNNRNLFVHAKNRPMTQNESVLVFSQYPMGHKSLLGDKRMRYNAQGLEDCNRINVRNGVMSEVAGGFRPSHKTVTVQTKTGYPSDVLYYDVPSNKERVHPTQKPVDLLEYLIRTYTDEGQTVLDFTMGSGSTGVACVNTGRDFIGIELDNHYYEIACKRISEANKYKQEMLNIL